MSDDLPAMSQVLLEARDNLLSGIMATWAQPAPAKPPPVRVTAITLASALEAAEKYRLLWQAALAEKNKLLADCYEAHTSPGDNYWLKEHRARALYGAALQLVEALS